MPKIYDNVEIAEGVSIGAFTVIGKPSRSQYEGTKEAAMKGLQVRRVVVSKGCFIDAHVVIEDDVNIGINTVIETGCIIESGVEIGADCHIVHGARILQKTRIADGCVIGGFIADRSYIGEGSRVLGTLLHKQDDPGIGWDENVEMAPNIGKSVFVGIGAIIIGDVTISENVYVCAGAIVTKDVPSFSVVRGRNEVIPVSNWKGRLREATFWSK